MLYGIFGGTFDPFTIAHYEIVKKYLEYNVNSKVIIIPTIVDYYRKDKKELFDLSERRKIIEKWFENDSRVILDFHEYELAINTKLYYDDPRELSERRYLHMLQDIISRYNIKERSECQTIIGADSYRNLQTWYEWKEILNLSELYVFGRGSGKDNDIATICTINDNLSEIGHKHFKILDSRFSDMSASKVRMHLTQRFESENENLSFLEIYLKEINELKNMQNIDIDNEELIAKTPIFDLVKCKEVEEGFRPVKINSNDWVSIIVEKDGKFLMTKQLRHGLNKEFEEFPCGIVEKGEDVISAGVRELREETGIKITNNISVHYLGKFAANPAFMSNYMHFLHVNLDYANYEITSTSFDEHEHLSSYWVDKQMAFDNFIKSEGSTIMGCAWMLLMKRGLI